MYALQGVDCIPRKAVLRKFQAPMHDDTYPWASYESIDQETYGESIKVSTTRDVYKLIEARAKLKSSMKQLRNRSETMTNVFRKCIIQ